MIPESEVLTRAELLATLDDDEHLLDRILNAYLNSTPALVDRLVAAVRDGDLKEIELTAHTLYSSLGPFGAAVSRSILKKLENNARSGDISDNPSLLDEFTIRAAQISRSLEDLRSTR